MYRPLIIDDEKPVHRVINALGHWFSLDLEESKSAYDGLAGLAAMRELRPDIVFLDMKMPLMNGIEFLKTASPEFPKTKFIVVSGYDEFTYTKIAIQYHVLDYLLKPIVEEELNAALKKARDLLDEENHIIRTDKPAPPTVSTEFLADAVKGRNTWTKTMPATSIFPNWLNCSTFPKSIFLSCSRKSTALVFTNMF